MGILAGAALIQGRPFRVRQNLRYSTQPWTDPKRAARDGVAVIPPLTTPTGPSGAPPRTDIVYLDVWEREVGSVEDANLINPAIGVETCIRLKREGAVRVAEGTATLPSAPAGHVFLPLALLRRAVNQAEIFFQHIESIRPYFYSPQGTDIVSYFPAFLPVATSFSFTKLPEWRLAFSLLSSPFGQEVPKFCAIKPQNEAAAGVLPLPLPHRADLVGIQLRGYLEVVNAQLQWQLVRISHNVFVTGSQADASKFYDILAEDTIRATTPQYSFGFDRGLGHLDREKRIVDNG